MVYIKRICSLVLALTLIFSGLLQTTGEAYAKAQPNKAVHRDKAELIIKYKDAQKSESIRKKTKEQLKLTKLDLKQKMKRSKLEVLEVAQESDVAKVIAELKRDPNVEYVQPNYKLSVSAIDDKRYNEQWALPAIGAEAAWGESLGAPSTIVGVLDTGMDIQHPDLAPNVFINTGEIPGNGIDDDGNGYIDDVNGWNFADGSSSVYAGAAEDSHGTHVAGIIAAKDDANGVRGVAPGVTLLPLKFISGTTGYTSDVIEAIEYAKQMGVRIINASFGGSDENAALRDAIANSGMLFVSSSGNNGQDVGVNPVYPAAYDLPNVISVTSVDSMDSLAPYANFGSNVDVAAPGTSILSTLPDGSYGLKSGTSMAAGFVTGIAALLQSKLPDLTADQLASRIKQSAKSSAALEGKVAFGLVHAAKALDAQSDAPPVTPPPASNGGSGNGDSMVVTLAAEVSEQLMEEIHYGEEGVNVATGNYATSVTDMSVTAPGFQVNISRTYNSKDERTTSSMGRGWTFGFEGSLKDDKTNTNLKVAKLPNGGAQVFVKNGTTYTANDSHSTLVKQADNSHILTTKDQYSYGFNAAGYLTWMKDRNGNELTINVDATGKVGKIIDTVGREYTVTSDSNGYITQVTDPMGRTVTYAYEQNRLSTVTGPTGEVVVRYDYDPQGYLTQVKDGGSNVLEKIIYDHATGVNQHKVVRYSNAFGNVQTFSYDTSKKKTTIKDVEGRTIVKEYDG